MSAPSNGKTSFFTASVCSTRTTFAKTDLKGYFYTNLVGTPITGCSTRPTSSIRSLTAPSWSADATKSLLPACPVSCMKSTTRRPQMPEPENNGPQDQAPQPAGKPYSVRRVNNVPLVIGFCLVAAFVAIVFLVVLPSNDNARK